MTGLLLGALPAQAGNNPELSWVRTYNDARWDAALGVAVDKSGDVHVVGGGWGFLDIVYHANGDMARMIRYDDGDVATGVAIGGDGGVYMTGWSDYYLGLNSTVDFLTIKYVAGVPQWVRTYNSGADDYANGIAVDKDNNVYVTGGADNGVSSKYLTVKYDASGKQIWAEKYGGIGYHEANAIAVDSQGYVYVTGESTNNKRDYDYLTIKYRPSGQVEWVQRFDSGGQDRAYGIAVDGQGHIYVTGESNGDYLTIKYDSNGNRLWTRSYDSGNNDAAYAIAVDRYGDVYVTGSAHGYSRVLTIKYSPSGEVLWTESYNSGTAYAITVDHFGQVYVAGSFNKSSSTDYLTIKYRQQQFAAALEISTEGLSSTRVGESYSTSLQATGGFEPYSWSVSEGTLPPGLTLNGGTGTITGIPLEPGSFNFTVAVTDAAKQTATKALSITVAAPVLAELVISSQTLNSARVGEPYSDTLQVNGGLAPYSWSVEGTLPPGLALDSGTGAITGTPLESGSFSFTVTVTDATGQTAAKVLSITVAAPALPDLVVSSLSAPTSAKPGAKITLSDTTANIGNETAAASTTRFYLSRDAVFDPSDTLLSGRSVSRLAPGASSSGKTSVTIPKNLAKGTYYIIAVADALYVVTERDEGNNSRAVIITVK